MQSVVRASNGYYKIRLRVCKELKPFIDAQEINKSLKTKKLSEARARALSFLSEYQELRTYAGLSIADKESLKRLCDNLVGYRALRADRVSKGTPKASLSISSGISYKRALESFKGYYATKATQERTRADVIRFLDSIFMPLVGLDTALSDTDLNALIDIRDKIQRLPNQNLGRYKGKSVKQLLLLSFYI